MRGAKWLRATRFRPGTAAGAGRLPVSGRPRPSALSGPSDESPPPGCVLLGPSARPSPSVQDGRTGRPDRGGRMRFVARGSLAGAVVDAALEATVESYGRRSGDSCPGPPGPVDAVPRIVVGARGCARFDRAALRTVPRWSPTAGRPAIATSGLAAGAGRVCAVGFGSG